MAALQAEIGRLDALALPALAAEVMVKGFGPGAPGADEDNTISVEGPNISAGPTMSTWPWSSLREAMSGDVEHALGGP